MVNIPPPPPSGNTPPPLPSGPPPPPGFPSDSPLAPPAGGGAPPPPGYVPFGTPQAGGGQRTNGLAVASLVLGIVGIVLCVLFIPWILAIIFGAVAIKQCNADPTYTGKGLAIAGLVCGLIGMGLIVLIFAVGDTNFDYDLGSVVVGALR
jgi:hypothetical protein